MSTMSRLPAFVAAAAFVAAGGLAWGTSHVAASWVETRSVEAVSAQLSEQQLDWVEIYADGLLLTMVGTAPSEAARFRAMSVAGGVVEARRLIDAMDVVDPDSIAPPRFSLEILRNDKGISLIGLVPSETGRAQVTEGLESYVADVPVTDMVEEADHDVPERWSDAVSFALRALEDLPSAKISVGEDRVEITAITDSAEEKARLETSLARRVPRDVTLALNISAPRPVITPFTLRLTKSGEQVDFDACSADTEAARDRILSAAISIGLSGKSDCVVGLGTPSTTWARAVETAIAALAELGDGTLTFSDADVSIVAAETTSQAVFDRVIGQLESDLPDVFSLSSVLTPKPEADGDTPQIPEFVATLSPEGLLQMRGRLTTVQQEAAVLSFARAHFGAGDTYIATRQDPELPDGWPARVLAGLEAMAYLHNGKLIVQPDIVELRGETGVQTARADMARVLSDKLGEGARFRVDVVYEERLDPLANIPTPSECVARMNAVLEVKKITFAPGSATIDASAVQQLDQLADAFEDCERVRVEVAGHTDSQGREEMNQSLSQQRANAVRSALVDRGVLPDALRAVGYGETQPIEDNSTEEGREANRRIAFSLIPGPLAPPRPGDAAGDAAVETEAEAEADAESGDVPLDAPETGGAEGADAQDATEQEAAVNAPATPSEAPSETSTETPADTASQTAPAQETSLDE